MSSDLGCQFSFEIWITTVVENKEYFNSVTPETTQSKEFVDLLSFMAQYARWYEKEMQNIDNIEEFDLSDTVQHSGLRTFQVIFTQLFSECFELCKHLRSWRIYFPFMKRIYLKKLKHYVKMLDTLSLFLQVIVRFRNIKDPYLKILEHPLDITHMVDDLPFYKVASLYDGSNAFFLKGWYGVTLRNASLNIAMTKDFHQKSGNLLFRFVTTFLKGVRYYLDPHLRFQGVFTALQETNITLFTTILRNAESFAGKFFKIIASWILPNLEIFEEIWVPDESLDIISTDQTTIRVEVPSSHLPPGPVRCLLMCDIPRQCEDNKKSHFSSESLSSTLLIYCHGGGFVALRPEFHQIFLRRYAKELKIPIFCVDYSLSPEGPFPRPLEEVLFAYTWALKNPQKLGWTGERVYFMGDSAGGNIAMGVLLKIVELNIRRPDGIFCFYSPMILDVSFFPSRTLSLIDSILPLQFLVLLLNAYIGNADDENTQCSPFFSCESAIWKKRANAKSEMINEWNINHKDSAVSSTSSAQLPVYNHCSELEIFKDYPMAILKTVKAIRNPFLSPYLASDELLKKLPEVHFALGEFDLFLDECIAFGKRISALGNEVTLTVLDGLAHGFLQGALITREANEGSRKCLQILKDKMKME